MKYFITYLLILFFTTACGDAVNDIVHNGVCDGYEDWQNSDYVLPYPAGKSYKVTQGNCGSVSHIGSQQYSYDFDMPIDSTIVAIRAGTVYEVIESNEDGNGCPDDNHVYVEHTDGTVAAYVHLTKDGATVSEGDSVNQSDVIGKSGSTGCASGPHLHLTVFKNRDFSESLPINFSNTNANPRGLRGDSSYTAK